MKKSKSSPDSTDHPDPLNERVKRWLIGAYGETVAHGYYTQTHFAHIPGANLFHRAAKRASIAVEHGARNRIDLDAEHLTEDAVNEIIRAYEIIANPAQPIDETADDKAPALSSIDVFQELSMFRVSTRYRMELLELKLDAILKAWDIEIPTPPPSQQAAYLWGIAKNRIDFPDKQMDAWKSKTVNALLALHEYGANLEEIKPLFKKISSFDDLDEIMKAYAKRYFSTSRKPPSDSPPRRKKRT